MEDGLPLLIEVFHRFSIVIATRGSPATRRRWLTAITKSRI
jgi:hypothetical protein